MASFLRPGEGSASLPGLPKVRGLEDNQAGTGTGSSDSKLHILCAAPLCQLFVLCSGHYDPHSSVLQTSQILTVCLISQRSRFWRGLASSACLLIFVLISPFQAPQKEGLALPNIHYSAKNRERGPLLSRVFVIHGLQVFSVSRYKVGDGTG